jgi:hypothetical protein
MYFGCLCSSKSAFVQKGLAGVMAECTGRSRFGLEMTGNCDEFIKDRRRGASGSNI